jgi:MSHA pilin protein MshD
MNEPRGLRAIYSSGVSLIEAVMFIVVVSVALVVVLKAFDIANQGSADPLLRRQSMAIAQSLLDEITAKPFGSAATDVPADGYLAGPVTSATRASADDVDDYNGFSMTGISRLDNTLLTGLSNYQVSVAVVAAAFGTVPASAGWRITVTVTDPSGAQLALDGYRANY